MRAILLSVALLAACSDSHSEFDEECGDSHEAFSSVSQAVAIPPGSFGVVVLDVGQGDATIVVAPGGCAALLDGGPSGAGTAVIKPNLASLGITSLDFVVTSHYHADHLGGLDEVDAGSGAVPIGVVYDRGGTYSSAAFTAYDTHFAGRRRTVVAGQQWSLCGEVQFTVIASNANGISTTNENAKSVVVKVSYGQFDALIGGDMTGASPDIESTIASAIGEIELYKVHHHGSSTSSNATLLATTLPTVSTISLAMNNSYGHPDPNTVARLQGVGTAIWMTEDPATSTALGHIRFESPTGAGYVVSQGAASTTYMSKGVVDTTPPTVPTDVAAATTGASSISLGWTASTDDTMVAGYRIYRSTDGVAFTLHASPSGPAFADSGLAAATTYWYEVSAVDVNSNESARSAAVSATTNAAGDTTPPTIPTMVTATAVSATQIDVAWVASTDAVGVTAYRIYRNGVLLATTAATSYSDTTVGPVQTHSYTITASDAAGNTSAASAPAQATTPSLACTVTVTNLTYSNGSKLLTVRATSSEQPTATLTVSANGIGLGTMSWLANKGYYELKKTITPRPACVTVSSSCGGSAVRCF